MADRDRVRRAIAHRPVYPVPYRLKFAAGVAERVQETLGLPDADRSLGNALVHLKMAQQPVTAGATADGGQPDEWGCVWHTDRDGGPYVTGHPLANGGVDAFTPPDPDWPLRFRGMAQQAETESDRFILFSLEWSLFERAHFLRGMEQFLVDMLLEPDLAHALLDRILGFNLAVIERACQLPIDGIIFGDDYGTQRGLLMSPALWRQFIGPNLKRLVDVAHRYGARFMLHCCGSIRALLPDMIDAGLDAVNPVQISTAGMEAGGLKRDFGRDIVLWGGGCDTQTVLRSGTPREVRAHVKAQVDALAPGGGFVFQQVHNILAGIPPENISAMFDSVRA